MLEILEIGGRKGEREKGSDISILLGPLFGPLLGRKGGRERHINTIRSLIRPIIREKGRKGEREWSYRGFEGILLYTGAV